jgi:hypothetical protein
VLSNHHVVLPRCTQALAFIELPGDNVASLGFNLLLSVHHIVRTLYEKKNDEEATK